MGDWLKILRCFFHISNPRESFYTLPAWASTGLHCTCYDYEIQMVLTLLFTLERWLRETRRVRVFLTRNRGCDVPITPSFVCFITELQKSGKIVTWNYNPFRAFLALNSWTSPPINGDLNEAGETRVTFYLQHWVMRRISSQISRTFL